MTEHTRRDEEQPDDGRRRRAASLNVRADLVGSEQDAERLSVDDDQTTALATMIFGGLLVLVSLVVLLQAARLDNGGNAVGPATVPWVVGALLLVVGVLTVLRARRDLGAWAASEHTGRQDWARLGLLLAALVVFAAVIGFLGYVVSATLLFGVAAIVLGSRNRPGAFAYGFIVAAVVFLVFDVGIGISLPSGPWGF